MMPRTTFPATDFLPAPADLSGNTVWSGTTTVFFAAAVAMGAAALVYCLYELVRRRDALPVLLWLGGFGGAFVAEPLLGHLGHIWWPRDFPGPEFTAFGAHVPGLVPPVYSFYLGMLGLIGYRLMKKGMTARQIWTLWIAFTLTDVALQLVAVTWLKAYFYYGSQPFDLGGLPLVGPVKNGTAYLLIGALVVWAAPRLRGAARLLLILVPLTGYLTSAISTAWPWYLAVNIDVPAPVAWLIAVGTFALCLVVVRGIAAVFGTDAVRHVDVEAGVGPRLQRREDEQAST